jgi:sterol desaturase/sphingolipid hydroxylase (fatty acid hydroxylase superfamily)
MVVINALHTHAGYAFPWMSYAVHHDWHHCYVNRSFSAIRLMDKLFGTDKAFDALKTQDATRATTPLASPRAAEASRPSKQV